MQTYFKEEMEKLKSRIINMFELVENQVYNSSQKLISNDLGDIAAIRQQEHQIDELDIKIDKLCQRIFALSQPVATDLRFIMSSLRIANEMERVGDMAYDISKRSAAVNEMQDVLVQFHIHSIIIDIIKIIKQLHEAYINLNTELSLSVIKDCRNVEAQCKSAFNEIVAEMSLKSKVIIIATDLILIMRNLERSTGHLENIAEAIIFIAEGRIVKHNFLGTQIDD